jgi:hypothetical protein
MATETDQSISEIVSDLMASDECEMEDGTTIRVRWEPDTDSNLMDEQGEGEWCGKLAWPKRNRDLGRDERPDGFTGGAEIIRLRDGNVWWEVPVDLRGEANREARDSHRRAITDLLEYGYDVAVVEVCEGTDVYGRPIVRNVASIGGVEFGTDDVGRREILGDLVREVLDETA